MDATSNPRPIPRKIFVVLAVTNLILGAVLLSLGLATFTFTDDYRTGTFCTGFVVIIIGTIRS